MRNITCAAIAAGLLTLTAADRASAQECRALKYHSNFRLNGAQQYIDQADRASYGDQKRGQANNALRVLREAAAQGGADPYTQWYQFGRAYLLLDDFVGADSAFAKATPLAGADSACVRDIHNRRRNLWIPLQQEAVGQMQAQHYDSALVLLRRANQIFRDDPTGYMNMASIFLTQEKTDSAVAAYRLASHAGTSADRAELRADASRRAAMLLQQANRPEAEAAWREYLTLKPRDVAARAGLASFLASANRPREAAALYDSILAQSDSLDAQGLFTLGGSLFRLAQTDSVNRTQWFRLSARGYAAGLVKSPQDREGLFFAANIAVVLADTAGLQQYATRLVAVDSMNRRSLSLLAQAQQMAGQRNEVVRTLMRRDSLRFEINIARFGPRDSTASIQGRVLNLQPRELPEFQMRIEFLNSRGDVVATESVTVGPLGAAGSPGGAYDFNLQTNGRGITNYRYKV